MQNIINIVSNTSNPIFFENNYKCVKFNSELNDFEFFIEKPNEDNKAKIMEIHDFLLFVKKAENLFLNYLGTTDDIMLKVNFLLFIFSLDKNIEALTESEIDKWLPEKYKYYNNLEGMVKDIHCILDIYVICMEPPFEVQNKICLSAMTSGYSFRQIPNSNYKNRLEISVLKRDLLDFFIIQLQNHNILSYKNLAELIFFYAINDSYMPEEMIVLLRPPTQEEEIEEMWLNKSEEYYKKVIR